MAVGHPHSPPASAGRERGGLLKSCPVPGCPVSDPPRSGRLGAGGTHLRNMRWEFRRLRMVPTRPLLPGRAPRQEPLFEDQLAPHALPTLICRDTSCINARQVQVQLCNLPCIKKIVRDHPTGLPVSIVQMQNIHRLSPSQSPIQIYIEVSTPFQQKKVICFKTRDV